MYNVVFTLYEDIPMKKQDCCDRNDQENGKNYDTPNTSRVKVATFATLKSTDEQ